MTSPVLTKKIFLKAPPEMVWAYLTRPEHLAKWFHAPKTPLAAGQTLEMFGSESGDKLIWGKVVAARPPSYLEYTFTVAPMGGAVSTVAWSLRAVPGGTELSLQHSGLPEGAAAFDLLLALDGGWDDHLARLRTDLHAAA